MDLSSFISLLRAEKKGDEEGNKAREDSEQFRKEDPITFLKLCLETIQSFGNGALRQDVAAAVIKIFSMTKIHELFLNEDLLVSFWNDYTPILHNYLMKNDVSDQDKKIFSSTLSNLFISLIKNEQDTTQLCEFIFGLIGEDIAFVPYLVPVITDTLNFSSDFAGFDPETLISFWNEVPMQDSVAQFALYFAIASHSNDNENVHESLGKCFDLIESLKETPDLFSQCFSIIEEFSQNHGAFFAPHIQVLTGFLVTHLNTSSDDRTKISILYTIQNIIQAIPNVCSENETFYEPVFQVLFNLMNVVDENHFVIEEFSYSVNTIARDVFNIFSKHTNFEYVSECLIKITSQESINENSYGALVAFSNISTYFIIGFLNHGLVNPDLYMPLLNIILQEGIPPFIRYECYHAFTNILKKINHFLANIIKENYFDDLFGLISNDNSDINVLFACIQLIREYFEQVSQSLVKTSDFESIYTNFMQLFDMYSSDLQIITELMKCFCSFISKYKVILGEKSGDVEYFKTLIEFLTTQLDSFEEITPENVYCKMELIFCYMHIIENKHIFTIMQIQNFNPIEKFYDQLIAIIKAPNLYNPSILPKLYKAFFTYVSHLGQYLDNHKSAIMEECFSILRTPVDIEEYLSITNPKTKTELENNYYFIPNPPENRILYVSKQDIQNYHSCFKILRQLCEYQGTTQHTDIILEICSSFFTPLMIEPLRVQSWETLCILLEKQPVQVILPILGPFIDICTQQMNVPWTVNGLNVMMRCIQLIIKKFLKAKEEIDGESFTSLLPLMIFMYHEIIRITKGIIADGEEVNLSQYGLYICVENYCSFVRNLGKFIQPHIGEAYISELKQISDELIQQDNFHIIIIQINTAFATVINDEAFFNEVFQSCISVFENAKNLNSLDPTCYSSDETYHTQGYLDAAEKMYEEMNVQQQKEEGQTEILSLSELRDKGMKIRDELVAIMEGLQFFFMNNALSPEKTQELLHFFIDYKNSNKYIYYDDELVDNYIVCMTGLLLSSVPDENKGEFFEEWWKLGVLSKASKRFAFKHFQLLLLYFDNQYDSFFKIPNHGLVSTTIMDEFLSRVVHYFEIDEDDRCILTYNQTKEAAHLLSDFFEAHPEVYIKFNQFRFFVTQQKLFFQTKENANQFYSFGMRNELIKTERLFESINYCVQLLNDTKKNNPEEEDEEYNYSFSDED